MKNGLRTSLSLIALCTSCMANAATITGVVKDNNGNPVAGAVVRVEGGAVRATTDSTGAYVLNNAPDDHVHLHVYSPNHIHGERELNNVNSEEVADFVLQTTVIENVTVTANALERSVLETTVPVTVLTGEDLRKNSAPTLGEMLQNTPGVHTTYFGPVASSPIIRGTDGPRVKVVQNSLDVSDASRVGADHNVAVDGSTAQQIEVLRGPATLQYGNGAIGGVVNVVDNRIPRTVPEGVEGEAEIRYESVSDEEFARIDLNAGAGNMAFHFDAFDRSTENYDIPGFAEVDGSGDDANGTLPNSSIDTTSFTAGLSYVGDSGYIGFSVQNLDNLYGIPGHSHDHGGHDHGHDDDHDDHGHDEDHDDHSMDEEEIVNLDVNMDRYQLAGEWYSPFAGISKIKFASGFTDYEHTEFENGSRGTTFRNETTETRLTLEHEELAGWHGVVGVHYANTDYEAVGAEAFTPPSETDSLGLFVIEERKFGDVTVQLGARYESTDIDPIDSITVESGFVGADGHHHDDDHDEHHDEEGHHDEGEGHDDDHHDDDHHDDEHHDEHEGEHHHEPVTLNLFEQSYDSLSLSAGMIWEYQEGRSVAMSLSRSERAPSHQELFSAGNHVATRTFDLGALFSIDDEGNFAPAAQPVEEEVSTNLDLTFRKYDGDWGYSVSFFYNQVDDYLYMSNTGLFAERGAHDHGHDHDDHDDHGDEHHGEEGHDEHGDEHHGEEGHGEHGDEHHGEEGHGEIELGNPVFAMQQNDADLYGFEAQVYTRLNDIFSLEVYGDYIRARLDDNVEGSRNLPRIPPLRLGAELDFEWHKWDGDIGVTWFDDQNDNATFETQTDGYTLVNFSVNYREEFQGMDWVFYLRGRNLFDEEARVHTSFIKDLAPMPGRNFAIGVRAEF